MGQWASRMQKDTASRKLDGQDTILFHLAAEDVKEVVADSFVQRKPLLIYDRNTDGDTALHVAARLGKHNMVKFLMDVTKRPEDVEALAEDGTSKETNLLKMQNLEGNTPLHEAVMAGHKEIVEFMIMAEDGTSKERNLLKMQNLEGNTPLHEAVMAGHKENVEFMIKEDSSLAYVKNNSGDSPLFLAVDGNFFDIAVHILDYCSGCSYEGRKGMTVLHAAAIRIRDGKTFRLEKLT